MAISTSGNIPEKFVVFAWNQDHERKISEFAAIDHRPLRDDADRRCQSQRQQICRAWIAAANGRYSHTRGCDSNDWLREDEGLATPRGVFAYLCGLGFSNANARWSIVEGFAVVEGCEWIWDEVVLAMQRQRPVPFFHTEVGRDNDR